MKVVKSKSINAFGGINFIFEYFELLGVGNFFEKELPALSPQSFYSWKDIIYSLYSIYFCNGEYVEDLNTIIKSNINSNPYCNITSSDTILRRLNELSEGSTNCKTKRGTAEHTYSFNNKLTALNIKLLQKLKIFESETLTLDYDNTIIFTEKKDSKMTYKKQYGYQPGVCTINEKNVLYVENRGGNSDAKSYQHLTLSRMFLELTNQKVRKLDNFRADSASYQFEVVKLIEQNVEKFYIAAKNSYVEKYYSLIENWVETKDSKGEQIWIGEIMYKPFKNCYKKEDGEIKDYRLIVKKKKGKDKQGNLITKDACVYRAIITNDIEKKAIEIEAFYNQRGRMERTFDVLKNDFGWDQLPFSKLSTNNVFLYLTAMCNNLYDKVIEHFSTIYKGIKPTFRMKRFVFKFIIIPAKWIKRSRQNILRIYGELYFRTRAEVLASG